MLQATIGNHHVHSNEVPALEAHQQIIDVLLQVSDLSLQLFSHQTDVLVGLPPRPGHGSLEALRHAAHPKIAALPRQIKDNHRQLLLCVHLKEKLEHLQCPVPSVKQWMCAVLLTLLSVSAAIGYVGRH